MNPNHPTNFKKGKSNKNKDNANLNNIKSKFILKKIITHIEEKKFMKIIQYNKNMQHRIVIAINNFLSIFFFSLNIKLDLDTFTPRSNGYNIF